MLTDSSRRLYRLSRVDLDDVASASEEDGLNDEFDSFMNAQPTTDRVGITAKQRQKSLQSKVAK